MGPFHLAIRPVHDYSDDHTVVEIGGEVDLATASPCTPTSPGSSTTPPAN
ncbi:hypothetical protein [Streptosporangium amethystogenes]|nr:hypothetical protein [Streptosporangium amethystogenes]